MWSNILSQQQDSTKPFKKSIKLLQKIFKKDIEFQELFFEEIFKMPDPESFLTDFLSDYSNLKDEIQRALISKEFSF